MFTNILAIINECGVIEEHFDSSYNALFSDEQINAIKEKKNIQYDEFYDLCFDYDVYINGENRSEGLLNPYPTLFPLYDKKLLGNKHITEFQHQSEGMHSVYITDTLFNSLQVRDENNERVPLTDVLKEGDSLVLKGMLKRPTKYNIYSENYIVDNRGVIEDKGEVTITQPAELVECEEIELFIRGRVSALSDYYAVKCTIYLEPEFLQKYYSNDLPSKDLLIRTDDNIDDFLQENGFSYFRLK